ncbi:hypothetical protein KAU39_06080 [bacterium]|nr:hypothetical protein [bacterium]
MKSSKKFIIAFGLIVFFFVSFNVPARSARYMTNAKFVDLIIRIMDLEPMLPADVEFMSVAELYRAKMEILARKGIYIFVGTDPGKMVRRRDLVNFLYFALVQNPSPDITDEGKFAFLIKRGFLSTGDLDGMMLEKELIKVLNIPKIITAMTETYIAAGSADEIKGVEFSLEVDEEPASPIY